MRTFTWLLAACSKCLHGNPACPGCQDEFKAEYSAATRIAELVKNYSQFISFPIYTWQEQTRDKEVRGAGYCSLVRH